MPENATILSQKKQDLLLSSEAIPMASPSNGMVFYFYRTTLKWRVKLYRSFHHENEEKSS